MFFISFVKVVVWMNVPDFNFRKGNPREKNATEGKCRYSKLIVAILIVRSSLLWCPLCCFFHYLAFVHQSCSPLHSFFAKTNWRKMEANIVSIHSEDLLKTFMVEMQGPFCPTTARQSVVNSRAKLHDISEISSLFHGNHRRPPKLFPQLLRMIDALIPPTSLAKCWFSIGLFGLIEGMYWFHTTFLWTIDLYHLQRNNRNARNLLPEIILGHFVSPYWNFLSIFAGANLVQSVFTGFCPLELLLQCLCKKRQGIPRRSEGYAMAASRLRCDSDVLMFPRFSVALPSLLFHFFYVYG